MTTIDSIIEKFCLLWGEAPHGTLKARKGKDIESFIRTEFEAREKELVEELENLIASSTEGLKVYETTNKDKSSFHWERGTIQGMKWALNVIKNKP